MTDDRSDELNDWYGDDQLDGEVVLNDVENYLGRCRGPIGRNP